MIDFREALPISLHEVHPSIIGQLRLHGVGLFFSHPLTHHRGTRKGRLVQYGRESASHRISAN